MKRLAYCTTPRYAEHQTAPHHPERPERILAVQDAVRKSGVLELGSVLALEPTPADEKWLLSIHTPEHVRYVKHVCSIGGGVLDQGDTPVGANSHEIALLSLGGVLRACDAVMSGQTTRAFAAVRPPGHHAEPDRPMGFCLYSNIAIAARYLQQTYNLRRVAIMDFDVHHGNGTQAAFDADPSVLFISLHQHPRTCYPGSGYDWEIGTGAGRGFTMNLPFAPGAGDDDYRQAFDKRVLPKLDEFAPEALLISAGFDAHRDDPLAGIELSDAGFETMTRLLAEIADRHCQGRVISALEGGYNLHALGRCVVRHMRAMLA